MRALQISGTILIAIGLWIILRPPSYSREESVFRLGDLEAKMQQEHRVPGWAGGIALGAGVVLLVVGLKKR
jgi:hypothetical protein